mgnify:FL=1
MEEVYRAEAYRDGAIDSHGDASCMLIRQYQFPNAFEPTLDIMISQNHDRIMQQDCDRGIRCFEQHTGTSELGFKNWVMRVESSKVITFLIDMLKADISTTWTGFRVLGTVNRSTSYPVWYLQLFAKHPNSETIVYNTENAPKFPQGKPV